MTTLGDQILADRKTRKLSRTDYGKLLGLTPTKVRNLEQGREPRPEELEALTTLLGVLAGPDPDQNVWSTLDGDVPIVTLTEDEEELPLVWNEPELPFLTREVLQPEPGPIADEQPPVVTEEVLKVIEEIVGDPRQTFDMVRYLDWQMDGIRRFSNSELRTFKECQRKWWLTYYRKLGLTYEGVTGARALGTRIHAALAVYYDQSTPREQADAFARAALEWTVAEDRAALEGDEFKLGDLAELEKDADMARAMLDGYLEWVLETGIDEGLEVIAPETVLDVDAKFNLEQPVRLIGKIDVRVRRKLDGAHLFIDHKTVGSLTEPLRMLPLDEQMLQYHLLEYLDLLEQGVEDAESVYTAGALYNMLKKTKRTARATPPFFDRVEVRHNIHELRSYWARVRGTVKEILEHEAALNAGGAHTEVCAPNPTRNCTWHCDFVAICPMFDDGSRVEDFVAQNFVEVNPLQRYQPSNE